jgi:hypothetical protein
MKTTRLGPRAVPAGTRSPRKAVKAFDFDAPPGFLNILGRVLGQPGNREIALEAARIFLDGKSVAADALYTIEITGARIRSTPTATLVPPAPETSA